MPYDPSLKTIPLNSLLLLPADERMPYLIDFCMMPASLQGIFISDKTGAFIRGLEKSHDLPANSAPRVAFAVLRVAVGKKTIAQLPALLSTELQVANDKAQAIAREIERDLFAPIALELNQYLASKKKQSGGMAQKLGIQESAPRPAPMPSPTAPAKFPRRPAAPPNILNLKDQRPGPKPPPIPR